MCEYIHTHSPTHNRVVCKYACADTTRSTLLLYDSTALRREMSKSISSVELPPHWYLRREMPDGRVVVAHELPAARATNTDHMPAEMVWDARESRRVVEETHRQRAVSQAWTTLLLYQYTTIRIYYYTILLLHSATLLLYYSTILRYSTTLSSILLYYYTIIRYYYTILHTLLLYSSTIILLYDYTAIQIYYYNTILPYHSTTLLRYYYTTILRYYYTTIMPYYSPIILPSRRGDSPPPRSLAGVD